MYQRTQIDWYLEGERVIEWGRSDPPDSLQAAFAEDQTPETEL